MKKQTAFQWYIEQHNIIVELGDTISINERFTRFSEIIEKTKEMEKEQIINAYHSGIDLEYCLDMQSPIEYYEQTYGGKK